MATGMPLLDIRRLDRADTIVAAEPFRFLVARGQLEDAARPALIAAFPRYRAAGFFPYQAADCGPALRALVEELLAPGFADAFGRHIGIAGLGACPALVTLCDRLNRRHGTLHTDSRAKVATALLYFNAEWPHGSAGCLRLLAGGGDIDAVLLPEIPPLYGTLVAFARSDASWHGHLPYEGPRKVLQVAWLADEGALRRKRRRGAFSRWLKRLAGGLDRRLGAGRGVNARRD